MFNIFYLFEDCLEMLMEKAACKTPQEEKSFHFTSLDVNEIPIEHHKG